MNGGWQRGEDAVPNSHLLGKLSARPTGRARVPGTWPGGRRGVLSPSPSPPAAPPTSAGAAVPRVRVSPVSPTRAAQNHLPPEPGPCNGDLWDPIPGLCVGWGSLPRSRPHKGTYACPPKPHTQSTGKERGKGDTEGKRDPGAKERSFRLSELHAVSSSAETPERRAYIPWGPGEGDMR